MPGADACASAMHLLTAASLPPAALFVAASAIVGVTKKAASENAATSTAKRVCSMRMLTSRFKCYGRLQILARGLRHSASTRVAGGPGRSAGPPLSRTTKPQQEIATTASKIVASASGRALPDMAPDTRHKASAAPGRMPGDPDDPAENGVELVQINAALQHPRYRASSP